MEKEKFSFKKLLNGNKVTQKELNKEIQSLLNIEIIDYLPTKDELFFLYNSLNFDIEDKKTSLHIQLLIIYSIISKLEKDLNSITDVDYIIEDAIKKDENITDYIYENYDVLIIYYRNEKHIIQKTKKGFIIEGIEKDKLLSLAKNLDKKGYFINMSKKRLLDNMIVMKNILENILKCSSLNIEKN